MFLIGVFSADDDCYNHARFIVALNGKEKSFKIPNWIIKPRLVHHDAWKSFKAYDELKHRQYSFHIFDNGIGFNFGELYQDAIDQWNTKTRYILYRWNEWTHINHSVLNLDKSLNKNVTKTSVIDGLDYYDWVRSDAVEKVKFRFNDFDGEEIEATCYIEFREWTRGYGFWNFLRFFMKNQKQTTLAIEFNKGVGIRKTSWKGGVIGTGIQFKDDYDSYVQTFLRFADNYKFTNIRGIS